MQQEKNCLYPVTQRASSTIKTYLFIIAITEKNFVALSYVQARKSYHLTYNVARTAPIHILVLKDAEQKTCWRELHLRNKLALVLSDVNYTSVAFIKHS